MGQLCNVKIILNQRYVQRQQREMRKKCKYFSQDEKPGAHERFNASLCNSEQKKKNKTKNPPAAGCKSNESTKRKSFRKLKISF